MTTMTEEVDGFVWVAGCPRSIACAVTGSELCDFFGRLRVLTWHYIIKVRKLESETYVRRSPG